MRSTRAAAAVLRLNRRLEAAGGKHHVMIATGAGLFILAEQGEDGSETPVSEAMAQDEFVAHVNGLGPQEVRRMTKNDVAFEKQLVKKPRPEDQE
ncbi:MAG TPA: hypothetical protein VH105_20525 [Burkholderiales bacterium]|jgi:hypothetical protein|nr:hypothetical protein [Burkholderiales bacterium]